MNQLQIINNSTYIKETIGFAILDEINVIDHPAVIEFCKIVYNYTKMKNVENATI